VRVENRDNHLVSLSCVFVQTPAEVSTKIRTKVASYLAADRRQHGSSDS
jgi:hypothetical protein